MIYHINPLSSFPLFPPLFNTGAELVSKPTDSHLLAQCLHAGGLPERDGPAAHRQISPGYLHTDCRGKVCVRACVYLIPAYLINYSRRALVTQINEENIGHQLIEMNYIELLASDYVGYRDVFCTYIKRLVSDLYVPPKRGATFPILSATILDNKDFSAVIFDRFAKDCFSATVGVI